MTRRLGLLAAVALLAAGCGAKPEPTDSATTPLEPFTVMLDYLPNADHAGIYAAQADGLYRKAGLDVKIESPPDPSAPLKLLSAGRADVAISYEPELLLARDQGDTDLVSVAALVTTPLTSLIALPGAHIRSAADLKGKTVGTAGIGYQHAYLQTILKHAGVDPSSVKEVNVGFNLVPALVSKKVDAILGGYWNYEGIQLEQAGKRPVIFHMDRLGVPYYDELVLVARKQDLNEAGSSRLRRFLEATAAGDRLVRKRPAFGVDALLKANPSLDRKLQAAAVRATLPYFFPAGKHVWGYMEPVFWANYERWMRSNGLLKQPPTSQPPLTDEFLPGEELDTSGS